MQLVYFILLIFTALIFFSIIYSCLKNGISPYPTNLKIKQTMLNHLPDINRGDIVDLGSGFGTLLFPIAKIKKNHLVIGYETSFFPYIVSKLTLIFKNSKNIEIQRKNFFDVSLNQASLVICFLYPDAMKKLKHKFENELKKDAYVISHTFAIHGWKPEKIVEVNDFYQTRIYYYKIK